MNNTEVINMGIHGYGTAQMYLYFETEGVKYQPDILIMGIIPDDVVRNTGWFSDYMRPRFKIKNGKLELTNYPILSKRELLEKYKKPVIRSYFLDYLRYNLHKIINNEIKEGIEINTLISQNLKSLAEKENIKFLVVLIPSTKGSRYEREYLIKDLIKASLEENKIDYLDLYPLIEEAEERDNLDLYDGHFNSDGTKLVADLIIEKLNEEKFI